MAKISIWNIGKANAELNASADVIAPALAKAGISTITFEGKTVAAADAPLSAQISALLGAQPVVADSQNAAEALVSNELISRELETAKTDLALKTTAVEALTRDKADLAGKLSTANAAVQDLTAKNSVLTTERDACSSQFASANKTVASQKLAIARLCQKCDAVKFNGADGKPLAADCTDADLAAAARDMTFDSMVSAYSGALNAAAARIGVKLEQVPSAGNAAPAAKKMTATEECAAAVAKKNKPV